MAAVPVKAGVAASIVGALCLYEVGSHAVNAFLESETLPSVTSFAPPTLRGTMRMMSPPWVRYGALMATGLLLGAVTQRRRALQPVAPPAAIPG